MTRVSLQEQYDNKDVIQQIYRMRDLVATGTYSSVTVADGTGEYAGKIVFTFTDQEGTDHIFRVENKDIQSIASSQSGSTVTVTITYTTGETSSFTFTAGGDMTTDTQQTVSGIKIFTASPVFQSGFTASVGSFSGDVAVAGAVEIADDLTVDGQVQIGDNLAVEDSGSDTVISGSGAVKVSQSGGTAYAVADLGSDQTIDGLKTFSKNLMMERNTSCYVNSKNNVIDRTADTSTVHWGVVGNDKNDLVISRIISEDPSTANRHLKMDVFDKTGTSHSLRLITVKDGSAAFVVAPYQSYSSAGSAEVLVKAQVADMPVVHLTSNESISGLKTHTGSSSNPVIACQSTDSSCIITGGVAKSTIPGIDFKDYNGRTIARLCCNIKADQTCELYVMVYSADGNYKKVILATGDP